MEGGKKEGRKKLSLSWVQASKKRTKGRHTEGGKRREEGGAKDEEEKKRGG